MNSIAKKLLIKSIDKWKSAHERLIKVYGKEITESYFSHILYVEGKKIFEHGVFDCPLCLKYNILNKEKDTWNECEGCPIKEYTKNYSCINTSYRTLSNYMEQVEPKTVTKKLILYHQRMINLMEKILIHFQKDI